MQKQAKEENAKGAYHLCAPRCPQEPSSRAGPHLIIRRVGHGVDRYDGEREERDGFHLVLDAREEGLALDVQNADDEGDHGDDELLLQRVLGEQGEAVKQIGTTLGVLV